MYLTWKCLIISSCFLTTLSKHFLIETEDNISTRKPKGRSHLISLSPERGGRGFLQSRIKVRPYFGPHLESRNRRVGGVKEGQSPEWFWEDFVIIKVHFGVQKGLGGGDLSIESRLFWRNICHFGANLTFKSDFESYFTFKKPHLRVQKWMGGGGPQIRVQNVCGPVGKLTWVQKVPKRGGINLSGLVQNLSEVN